MKLEVTSLIRSSRQRVKLEVDVGKEMREESLVQLRQNLIKSVCFGFKQYWKSF